MAIVFLQDVRAMERWAIRDRDPTVRARLHARIDARCRDRFRVLRARDAGSCRLEGEGVPGCEEKLQLRSESVRGEEGWIRQGNDRRFRIKLDDGRKRGR